MGLALLFRAAAGVPRIVLSYNTTSLVSPDEIVADAERIYGPIVSREERAIALPTVRHDRPRETRDVLLVFERRQPPRGAASRRTLEANPKVDSCDRHPDDAQPHPRK